MQVTSPDAKCRVQNIKKEGEFVKEITVQDCLELKEKFTKYCDTAEQHQFPMLAMVNIKLDATLAHIEKVNKVENQKEARAMFRVVLKIIGEDFSEYLEGGVT